MTLKVITILPSDTQFQIRKLLDSYQSSLTSDISNYAKDRQVYWLEYQADLTKVNGGKVYKPGIHIPRLWDYCSKLFDKAIIHSKLNYTPTLDLGLVAYGNKGISWHRDASYADYPAVSINLSTEETLWGYEDCRLGYDGKQSNSNPSKKVYKLAPGSVILFNCKNPHAVIKCDDTRYSINLWSINPKFKEYFNKYKESLHASNMEKHYMGN